MLISFEVIKIKQYLTEDFLLNCFYPSLFLNLVFDHVVSININKQT